MNGPEFRSKTEVRCDIFRVIRLKNGEEMFITFLPYPMYCPRYGNQLGNPSKPAWGRCIWKQVWDNSDTMIQFITVSQILLVWGRERLYDWKRPPEDLGQSWRTGLSFYRRFKWYSFFKWTNHFSDSAAWRPASWRAVGLIRIQDDDGL